MKEKPFISIIIPAYNAETTLKRCVRSVLIQDYEEYEIIVVDDGSKDETSAKMCIRDRTCDILGAVAPCAARNNHTPLRGEQQATILCSAEM